MDRAITLVDRAITLVDWSLPPAMALGQMLFSAVILVALTHNLLKLWRANPAYAA